MTLKGHLYSSSRMGGLRMSAAERAKGRFMRAPDDHQDDPAAAAAAAAAAETAAAEAAAAEAAAAAAANKTQTAEETAAALAAANEELEAARARLAEFEGIDAAAARENAKKVADAEKAAKEASAAAKKAEKERAAAENDVAKLREIQNEEHAAEVARIRAEKESSDKAVTDLQTQLNNIRLENAFNASKFIGEETILTGGKAQRLFSDYVDVVDGQVVVYDAPRGDAKRAKVMDNKGNALPFNDAIAKVINADPDKDSLLKSKTKPGAGSKTTDGKPTEQGKTRHEKLTSGLAALRAKNAR
jgi:hypothetical protein